MRLRLFAASLAIAAGASAASAQVDLTVNDVGLAIGDTRRTTGLLNYARDLRGVQIGVINLSDNGGRRRVVPIVNLGR